jgi:hypothetical protein
MAWYVSVAIGAALPDGLPQEALGVCASVGAPIPCILAVAAHDVGLRL